MIWKKKFKIACLQSSILQVKTLWVKFYEISPNDELYLALKSNYKIPLLNYEVKTQEFDF